MKNPEIIYFEGLPRSGKTTLTNQLSREYPQLAAVGEYIHPALEDESNWANQRIFMENDELKYKVAQAYGKQCLVDRGHLSTLLYTHAYNLIRGDKDLSYVDDWYAGTILKNKMLPDMYIYLDIPAEVSFNRRTIPLDLDNMWDHLEALNFARENYPRYIGTFEPNVPLITLSSHTLCIAELKTEVATILGLNIHPQTVTGL